MRPRHAAAWRRWARALAAVWRPRRPLVGRRTATDGGFSAAAWRRLRPALIATTLALGGAAACQREPPVVPLQAPVPAPGKTVTLDAARGEGGDTGWWPAVAFDRHERPHVAFCDAHAGDVRYAHEGPGGWEVVSLFDKGAVGKYISLDVDPDGRPALSFYDQDKMYLRYAWQDGAGAWHDEQVAWGREAGMGSELRFDHQGRPHLFYYLASGKLIHAQKLSDGWHKDVLQPATGVYSARLGSAARRDGVWFSYVDWKMRDAALYLGHIGVSGTFGTTQLSDRHGMGWHSQVVFTDDAPQVVASYGLTKQTAWLRADGKGGWAPTILVPHGSTFAARTHHNRLVLAYQDHGSTPTTVRYTTEPEAGPWPVYRIDDDGPAGGYMAMGVSPSGRLLVAYYADKHKSLKLYDTSLAEQESPQSSRKSSSASSSSPNMRREP